MNRFLQYIGIKKSNTESMYEEDLSKFLRVNQTEFYKVLKKKSNKGKSKRKC